MGFEPTTSRLKVGGSATELTAPGARAGMQRDSNARTLPGARRPSARGRCRSVEPSSRGAGYFAEIVDRGEQLRVARRR